MEPYGTLWNLMEPYGTLHRHILPVGSYSAVNIKLVLVVEEVKEGDRLGPGLYKFHIRP